MQGKMAFYGCIKMQNDRGIGSLFSSVTSPKKPEQVFCACVLFCLCPGTLIILMQHTGWQSCKSPHRTQDTCGVTKPIPGKARHGVTKGWHQLCQCLATCQSTCGTGRTWALCCWKVWDNSLGNGDQSLYCLGMLAAEEPWPGLCFLVFEVMPWEAS